MDYEFNIREDSRAAGEYEFEQKLRPLAFYDFSGQDKIVRNNFV